MAASMDRCVLEEQLGVAFCKFKRMFLASTWACMLIEWVLLELADALL